MIKKRGFTLIELLVVIAIIGILATIILVSYNNMQAKSRDSKRKSDLQTMASAMEIYYSDMKVYITGNSNASGAVEISVGTAQKRNSCVLTSVNLDYHLACLLTGGYINEFPRSPNNSSEQYGWFGMTDGSGYKFISDPRIDTYESSPGNDVSDIASCKENAREYADPVVADLNPVVEPTKTPCRRFQVSNNSATRNTVIRSGVHTTTYTW